MFPWMLPNATMGGQLSLLSLMQGGSMGGNMQGGDANSANSYSNPQAYWARMFSPRPLSNQGYDPSADNRADQTPQGNQPDTGNTMAPPDQTPRGGPDQNATMSGYDPNTVPPYWTASPLMRAFAMFSGGPAQQRNQRTIMNDPRTALQMGMYGLNMLQPRRYNIPGQY